MNLDLREIPFYYVNLERQPERKERMDDLLTRMEIKNFNRIVAIDGTLANVNGFAACAQSVANIICFT